MTVRIDRCPYLTLVVTVFFVLGFSLSACSTKPSEADARKVYETYHTKEYFEVSKVKSFKKINGQSREEDGVKIYVIEYEAELEYLKDNELLFYGRKFGRGKKGEIEKVTGAVIFEKTEKGWKGQDGKIY